MTRSENELADRGAERPFRVLHIGKYFAPHRGGMETFLRDLMAEQQRQGLAVYALVHATDRGLRSVDETRLEQGEQLRITRTARWSTLAFAPISPTYVWVLRRCIREQAPDILHIHMPNLSAFWCLLLRAARRLPWVVHWHADVLASTHRRSLRLLYRFYRPLEQALLRRAARIIVTSPPYLDSSEPLATHRRRCTVVPLGIGDLAAAETSRLSGGQRGRPAGTGTTAPRHAVRAEGNSVGAAVTAAGVGERLSDAPVPGLAVLCVGRLTYYKGIRHLIEAVARLDNVTLTIVGSGDEESDLRAQTHRLGIEDRVGFAGDLSDEALQVEFARCDCLCLPSVERTEAFGLVLLEAMRAGRATIATEVPGSGMGWVLKDGVTGLLARPEDPAALAHALKTLRDNPGGRQQLGQAGRKRFEMRFRIDRAACAVETNYRALMLPGTTARQQ